MERVRHGLCAKGGDIVRQSRVEGRRQPVRCDPAVELEVHDLALRVRAGISAARGVDHVVLAGQLAQRPLQLGFHRPAPRLLLPTGKSATVVLEHDLYVYLLID